MCEPVTLMMAAGTAMSALGAIQQGRAASANAKFQQQISMDNAARTSEEKRDALVRGADQEQQVLADGARVVANTRGALATNNMDLSFGSPLDTILATSVEVQRDAYRTRENTKREVNDLEVKRYNYLNNASAQAAEGKNAKTAGFIAGVGTALSGGAEIGKHRASIAA